MTRKTYYLSDSTAGQLEEAVATVQAALGGRLARHEVIAAIISAGIGQTNHIVAQLRAELLRDLRAPEQ